MIDDYSGLQKAAILLITLGPEKASAIFQHLKEDEIESLTLEIANTRSVSPQDKESVLDEYYQVCLAQQYIAEGGIGYAKELLEKALGSEKAQGVISKLTASLQVRPFEFVRKTEPAQLLNFIQEKMDWIPRTVRQRQRKIDEAIKNIELRTGKTANDADLAKELSISEDELCSWQSQLKVTNVVSLDEFDESGPEPVMDAAHNSHYAQPEEIVTQEELKTMLVKSLDNLTEKERRVIELYYYEDLTLKEISNILEVSESRVSQLHTKGLIKMRKVMGPYMNILTNA